MNLPVQYERADIGRCVYDINGAGDFNSTSPLLPSHIIPGTSFPLREGRTTALYFNKPTTTTTTAATTTARPVRTTKATAQSTTIKELRTTEGSITTQSPGGGTTGPSTCIMADPSIIEKTAMTFGNSDSSYAEIKIKKKNVSKKYVSFISFPTYKKQ